MSDLKYTLTENPETGNDVLQFPYKGDEIIVEVNFAGPPLWWLCLSNEDQQRKKLKPRDLDFEIVSIKDGWLEKEIHFTETELRILKERKIGRFLVHDTEDTFEKIIDGELE